MFRFFCFRIVIRIDSFYKIRYNIDKQLYRYIPTETESLLFAVCNVKNGIKSCIQKTICKTICENDNC